MLDNDRRTRGHIDWLLIVAVLGLSLFGIYCIANARFDPDKGTDLSVLGYIVSNRSSIMQTVFLAVSPFVVIVVMTIPLERYRARLGKVIYWGVLGLLMLTLGLASVVNGTRQWLSLGGARAFQTAEFAKIAVLLVTAKLLSESKKPLTTFREVVRLALYVGAPMILVLASSETGSVFVMAVMLVGMILFSGADIRIGLGLILAGVLGIGGIVVYGVVTNSSDYRILRLIAFTAPEKYPQNGGYQILNAQKAIGSGQLTGLGTFREGTVTQLGYVPESSTDFILSSIGEAFGFVGIIAIVITYALIIFRILYLGRYTTDKFGYLIINGVMFMLLTHVAVNILMCLGLFPITGIPLPFLSYGGSNLLTNMVAIGLVLNVTNSRSAITTIAAPLLKKQRKKYRKNKKIRPVRVANANARRIRS